MYIVFNVILHPVEIAMISCRNSLELKKKKKKRVRELLHSKQSALALCRRVLKKKKKLKNAFRFVFFFVFYFSVDRLTRDVRRITGRYLGVSTIKPKASLL